MMIERTLQSVAGTFELPVLADDDPLSGELDEAYFKLARGEAGAEAAVAAVEAKINEREASKRREAEVARRAAAHQERLIEAQKAKEQAEALRRAADARAALEPMWAELDAHAVAFARVAVKIMGLSMSEANASPHDEIVERFRVALYRQSDGVVQRRLLNEIGRPLPHNRQIDQTTTESLLESE